MLRSAPERTLSRRPRQPQWTGPDAHVERSNRNRDTVGGLDGEHHRGLAMQSGHEPVASLDEAAGSVVRNRVSIHMQQVSSVDQMQKEDAPVSIRLVEAEVLEPEAKASRVSLGGFRVSVGHVEVAALSGLLPKVWDAQSELLRLVFGNILRLSVAQTCSHRISRGET